jgi:hypothetical protein
MPRLMIGAASHCARVRSFVTISIEKYALFAVSCAHAFCESGTSVQHFPESSISRFELRRTMACRTGG